MFNKHQNTEFHDFFIMQLKNLYDAEKQLGGALPEVINSVSDKNLKKAISHHLKETNTHVERLDKIFNILGVAPSGGHSVAMEGLIKECSELIEQGKPSIVEDAVLIGAAQKIKHYEIACYGILRTFAQHLGYTDIKNLLQESLDDEGKMNKKLMTLAEGSWFTTGINTAAVKK